MWNRYKEKLNSSQNNILQNAQNNGQLEYKHKWKEKKWFLKTYIWSELIQGCEIWTIEKNHAKEAENINDRKKNILEKKVKNTMGS